MKFRESSTERRVVLPGAGGIALVELGFGEVSLNKSGGNEIGLMAIYPAYGALGSVLLVEPGPKSVAQPPSKVLAMMTRTNRTLISFVF